MLLDYNRGYDVVMTKNEITYKQVKITKSQEWGQKGKFFRYTADLRVSTGHGTRFLSVRESSLDRMKDSINDELNNGAKVVEGKLIHELTPTTV